MNHGHWRIDSRRVPKIKSVVWTGAALAVALHVSWPADVRAQQVSPSSLSFSAVQGSANPAPQFVTLSKKGGRTDSWTANGSASWLTVSPGSGTISRETDQLTVSVNAGGLAAGNYRASLVIMTSSGRKSGTTSIPVTLTVTAEAVAPAIGLSPTSLSFSGIAGGSDPSVQTIAVSNTGGGTLSWAASDNAAWLTASPTSGTNSGSITVGVNVSGIPAGTYTGVVTVSATGATTKTVPVTLTVAAATTSGGGGTIGFSPTALTFSGTVGGSNPAAKTVGVTNPGGGTLSWTVGDNAGWLSVSPTSGSTTTETDQLTASVNLGGLAAGTYNGVITIAASGATNSPQQIPVTLTLNASTAGSATLMWNANTETDVVGYKIYRATASGAYGAPVATLDKVTSYVATGLQTGTTYFFVITAFDSAGNESAFSNEVSKSIY